MECQFCKSILKTVSSLNFHIKNNKKCLEIQASQSSDIVSQLATCSDCGNIYSSTGIVRHLKICKVKRQIVVEQTVLDNEQLTTSVETLTTSVQTLTNEVERLRFENNWYKNVQERYEKEILQLKGENEKLKIHSAILERDNAIHMRIASKSSCV